MQVVDEVWSIARKKCPFTMPPCDSREAVQYLGPPREYGQQRPAHARDDAARDREPGDVAQRAASQVGDSLLGENCTDRWRSMVPAMCTLQTATAPPPRPAEHRAVGAPHRAVVQGVAWLCSHDGQTYWTAPRVSAPDCSGSSGFAANCYKLRFAQTVVRD